MKTELNVKRYKKVTHGIRILLQISFVTNIVLCVQCLGFSIFIRFASESTITSLGNGMLSFMISSISITAPLKEFSTTMIPLLNAFLAYLFVGMLICLPALHYLIKILKNVEIDKPFAKENSHSLAKIGRLAIVASFLVPIGGTVEGRYLVSIIKNSYINYNYGPNMSLLLCGVLLLILSGIFRYGNYLQHEYDTTL
jgi:hypothetical protein